MVYLGPLPWEDVTSPPFLVWVDHAFTTGGFASTCRTCTCVGSGLKDGEPPGEEEEVEGIRCLFECEFIVPSVTLASEDVEGGCLGLLCLSFCGSSPGGCDWCCLFTG